MVKSVTIVCERLHMVRYTAVGLRKTSLLHKQIKNHATLAYKNSVSKCYQDVFLLQICSLTIQLQCLKLKINN